MHRLIAIPAGIAAAAAASLALVAYAVAPTVASDHQDSPTAIARPGADLTDVYVFPASDPANVVLAMDVFPLIPSGLGRRTFFDPGVLYQFKVAFGSHAREDLVLQLRPSGEGPGQTLTMMGPAAPSRTGTRTSLLGGAGVTVPYDRVTALPGGGKVYAGPREDPFYFDLSRFYAIQPDRDFADQPHPPRPSARCFRTPGIDFLAGYNVLSIVVELPRARLAGPEGPGRINVWATTSVQAGARDALHPGAGALAGLPGRVATVFGAAPDPGDGSWVQVERLGRPAVKEVTEAFRDHETTDRAAIDDDGRLARSVRTYVTAVAGRSPEIADALVKVLIPDAIEADLSASGPARYLAVETNGKSGLPVGVVRAVPPQGIEGVKKALGDPYRHFGGRDPDSPVVDLSLGAIFGSLVPKLGLAPDDRRETECLTSDHTTPAAKHPLSGFPYLGDPR